MVHTILACGSCHGAGAIAPSVMIGFLAFSHIPSKLVKRVLSFMAAVWTSTKRANEDISMAESRCSSVCELDISSGCGSIKVIGSSSFPSVVVASAADCNLDR